MCLEEFTESHPGIQIQKCFNSRTYKINYFYKELLFTDICPSWVISDAINIAIRLIDAAQSGVVEIAPPARRYLQTAKLYAHPPKDLKSKRNSKSCRASTHTVNTGQGLYAGGSGSTCGVGGDC